MTPKELTAFRFDSDLVWGLRVVKARDGLGIAEQVRRAVQRWLEEQQATQRDVHQAFDEFESVLMRAHNADAPDGLLRARVPKGFGKLENRLLSSLSETEMSDLESFASAAGRGTKAYKDDWVRAQKLRRKK
jgi:hypothetical protein